MLACAEPSPKARVPDTDTDTDTDTDPVDALRADLAGTLAAVSTSCGWPCDGLFVRVGTGDWSLAGDFDDWIGEPMTPEDGFSWIVVEDVAGAYKFTDGATWEADPWSRRYGYDENGEMSYVDGDHLERLFLADRTVRIWHPVDAARVLYVHDGQNLFAPDAPWGGWHLQDTAPDGMMIVGIDNTDARFEEYTHVPDLLDGDWYGGEGDAYADYVRDSVRPLVDATYGEPPIVGTMGSSLGGLIAFHMAQRDDYAFAASLSGTMGWGSMGATNETMIERYAAAGHGTAALYLDSGGGGTCYDSDGDGIMDDDLEADDSYCENIQLRDVLVDAGYTYDVDLWHWHEPGAEHNEAAWRDRVFRPLEIFAGL